MNEQHRRNYVKGGYQFVECALCGQRFNAGRGGNGAGLRWCWALMNDWWAKHTGQESPEVVHVACDVEPCPNIKKEAAGMEIAAKADASGPLDGEKTLYTVALGGGKYVDVMHRADSGLLYVMQSEDGGRVYDDTAKSIDCELDEEAVIAFVKKEENI